MSGPRFPRAAIASANRSEHAYRVAAKLRPGVTAKAAQASLHVVTERLAGLYAEDKEYGAVVISMREGVAGDFRTPVIALSGALGFGCDRFADVCGGGGNITDLRFGGMPAASEARGERGSGCCAANGIKL